MRISLRWLADYVDLPPPDALAHQLTMAGLEVEGIERLGEGLDRVVVGQVLESRPHPSADKLSVTRVDAGGEPLQIVCGAKNYRVGDKVPVALVGARLPGGVEIKEANLRGVDSAGMLCSARELGVSDDASGLLILDPALKAGTPIAEALHLFDVAFEINVTPNRPDALSHLGIAREVHALTSASLRPPAPAIREAALAASAKASVRVDWPERCPRYMARVIEGVKVGPSPAWMQARLRAAGVRPISNLVDVTNYVLLELGHPLHAFDLDRLRGAQVIVRAAWAGEPIETLDGKGRTLTADDLVIADAERAIALAGVMGGANTEVSAGTSRILIESAFFQPAGIRRTARRHGLHTEASHRFERGTDAEGLALALDRAAQLIAELCGGQVLAGAIDLYPGKAPGRTARLRFSRLAAVLGAPVPADECRRILDGLGFGVCDATADEIAVSIPARRVDVEREEDLIEEVARIHGYDAISARLPRVAASDVSEDRGRATEQRVRSAMAACGLDEVVNYSFVSERELAAIDPARTLGAPIALQNPLSAEQSVMRTSLLPGLLQNLSRSLRHQAQDVRFHELGRVYRGEEAGADGQPAVEETRVAGVLYGRRHGLAWNAPRDAVDFYDAKGAVEQLLQALGVRARFELAREVPFLHPRAAAHVEIAGRRVGALGELHPRVVEKLDLPRGIVAFDLALEPLAQAAALVPSYRGLPRFPAVLRDLAVVLGEGVPEERLEGAIREAGGGLVEEVLLFDVYRGAPIPAGRRSLAFAIRYRAEDRTLTDAEAAEAHQRIVAALARTFGAELRA